MTRFDDTIKAMQDITSEIKNKADSVISFLDEESVEKVEIVANKTIDVINEASVKLKDAIHEIADEEELNKFLDRVNEKCNEAKKYAFNKIDEILKETDAQFEEIKEEKSTMEKFLTNENIETASNIVNNSKKKLVDFIKNPETKIKVQKIELGALNILDKGLDACLNLLDKNKDA